jgi:hypothetical protein
MVPASSVLTEFGVPFVVCVTSCNSSILMEETAKAIAALHPAVCPSGYLGRFA